MDRHQSECELVMAARRGDQEALVQLVEAHNSMIRKIASLFRKDAFTTEDLYAEGVARFLDVVLKDYQCDRGASLKTFAARCVRQEMIRFLQQHNRHRPPAAPYDAEGESPEEELVDEDTLLGIEHSARLCTLPLWLHDCLKNPVTEQKWVILWILRVLPLAWKEGVHCLRQDAPPRGWDWFTGRSWWPRDYPKRWEEVCSLFQTGESAPSLIGEDLSRIADRVRQWHWNVGQRVARCLDETEENESSAPASQAPPGSSGKRK